MEPNVDPRLARQQKRAETKAEYRRMTHKLYELNKSDQKEIQLVLSDQLKRGSELYPVIKKKLDGTAVDSKHVKELSSLGREASTKINVHSQPFDLSQILKDLMRAEGGGRRKRFELTEELEPLECFCLAPTYEFFYGALRVEDIVKVERKRRVREKLDEAQTKRAKYVDVETEVQQDSTPKEVEMINKKIQTIACRKPEGTPFFDILVDPKSFAQTVENIFHASFLVKEGQIGIKRNDSGKAVIVLQDKEEDQDQSVLSFSIENYKRWIRNRK